MVRSDVIYNEGINYTMPVLVTGTALYVGGNTAASVGAITGIVAIAKGSSILGWWTLGLIGGGTVACIAGLVMVSAASSMVD